ncbi:hypothetical protein CEXT_320011 [Caerostris extrusa]|uniref:Uncharacterized protein n=1 Tax=Caerostris extrusa TaxID=172846 RepID=A0AAV4YDL5_CAEEX|nr:hypothetical protein CEXT_320011 [Caerostris extrusa]
MDEHHNDSSQIENSRISLANEVLYSTRNPIHTLNTTEQPETFSFATLAWDDPLENLLFFTNSLSRNNDENIFYIPETDNTNNIIDPVSIPGTSQRMRATSNESNATDKSNSEDKTFSRNVISSKELNTPSGNAGKQSPKCSKDQITLQLTDHLESPERPRTAARPRINASFVTKLMLLVPA